MPAPAEHRPCHCLCGVAHPQATGICRATQATHLVHVHSRLLGPVAVPLCWPCYVARQHDEDDSAVNLWMLVRPSLVAAIAQATADGG